MPIARATPDAFDRARKTRLLLFDVDGVLTDGTIWVVPSGGHAAPQTGTPDKRASESGQDGGFGLQSQTMAEMKGFSAHDGMGVSLARVAGLDIGFVTKRVSEAVKARARDLKLKHLYMGQAHKMNAIRDVMEKTGLRLDQIAYAGDDVIDLPVMRVCGFAIAPCNARAEVVAAAHFITEREGGYGAGRDAIEFILKAWGVLEKTIEEYIDERSGISADSDIGAGDM